MLHSTNPLEKYYFKPKTIQPNFCLFLLLVIHLSSQYIYLYIYEFVFSYFDFPFKEMTTSSDQPLPPSPPPPAFTYPPIIIILSIFILIVFFVGFFSIYFCRCFVQNLLCMWHLRGSATATPVAGAAPTAPVRNGLDPSIVQSFPSFAYSTVKDFRVEKYGLECAICLLEFKDSDLLRLLTTCCHVFHQECIDLWLESHNTCPVCRRNLTSPAKSPSHAAAHENEPAAPPPVDEDHHDVSFSITVKDENEDVRNKGEGISCGLSYRTVGKWPRSHSTGHSLGQNRENISEEEDRFTLRLPQYLQSRIIRGHNSSKSWSLLGVGEYKDKDSANKSVAQVTGVSGDDNV